MFIHEMFQQKPCVFSVEVFPPKKAGAAEETLYPVLRELCTLGPDYISVTYGAGGGTAGQSTAKIASYIKNGLHVEALAHLTCVNSTRVQVEETLTRLREDNVENVLALRGDINPDLPRRMDFLHASDLAKAIAQTGGFGVAGACYPEGHVESPSLKADVESLRYKAEAGVSHLITLYDAVLQGLKAAAAQAARTALQAKSPEELVNEVLIPALDTVGAGFEKGVLFLPQLLQSAGAAQAAFEVLKDAIAASGKKSGGKGKIIVATVKGDIHDIGKNIVKTLLENYGYDVLDLGRDVPAETVVKAAQEHGVRLVGLSALMTTTLGSMEETICALRRAGLSCRVMVGGAVLTPEYAMHIGADYYAKDAKQSVDIAREVLG